MGYFKNRKAWKDYSSYERSHPNPKGHLSRSEGRSYMKKYHPKKRWR